MELSIFQVDAFTNILFAGNPAAVVPLETWFPDATLQSIAFENNLAETAFFVPTGDRFHLRWFTPTVEMDLCGHATLASARVLFHELAHPANQVVFDTKSGPLTVRRQPGDLLAMDFPGRPPTPIHPDPALVAALGPAMPLEIRASRDYFVVYDTEQEVHALQPDMSALLRLEKNAVIATAKGDSCDFVSRFFAPKLGVPEDPVTGSAHSTLIPYWAEKLGKTTLHARQISPRGGELFCKIAGDRVEMAGHSVLYLTGKIHI